MRPVNTEDLDRVFRCVLFTTHSVAITKRFAAFEKSQKNPAAKFVLIYAES